MFRFGMTRLKKMVDIEPKINIRGPKLWWPI